MTERNTVTLARKVLRAAQRAALLVYAEESDAAMDHFVTCAHAAPDLARAVVELTAERDAYREENTRFREQAARVKALADRLDHEAEARRAARQDPLEVLTIRQEAARIRAELNGENR